MKTMATQQQQFTNHLGCKRFLGNQRHYLYNLVNISTVWKSDTNSQVNDVIVALSDYNLATVESISWNQYPILTDSILWTHSSPQFVC